MLLLRQDISQKNKDKIWGFLDRLKSNGLSPSRQVGHVQRMTAIAAILVKDFDKATKHNVEQLTADIKTEGQRDYHLILQRYNRKLLPMTGMIHSLLLKEAVRIKLAAGYLPL